MPVQHSYLIIVAGGTGSRMKSAVPKQFMELQGQPVIIRTIRRFLEYNASIRIIISVHADYLAMLSGLLSTWQLQEAGIQLTVGGSTRFESVKNGLKLIKDATAIVGIHDAARPLVSIQAIRNCYEGAALHGNAIPCVRVSESLRELGEEDSMAVNRDNYRIVQTPQCFLVSAIQQAFEQEYSPDFTDDATVLEAMGGNIHLVEGNVENIKITTPNDLLLANCMIHHEQ